MIELRHIFRRQRAVVLGGLAGLAALAWLYTAYLAVGMGEAAAVADIATPKAGPWNAADFALMFVMWAVMMVAMMTPSVAPMVLLFDSAGRSRRARGRAVAPTWIFVFGYLVAWVGFSLLATLVQWALHEGALLSAMMESASPMIGGLLLMAAGVYQWTPLKQVCLRHCRTPLNFLLSRWREGVWGAFLMGLEHGAYCVGCCWALMGLLFVAGVMNLLWVAGIAAFVLVEKILPRGDLVGRLAGALLIAVGLVFLVQGSPAVHPG